MILRIGSKFSRDGATMEILDIVVDVDDAGDATAMVKVSIDSEHESAEATAVAGDVADWIRDEGWSQINCRLPR